jgi:outer membrane protein OmpA-like peptidoglycan-associated protein
VIAALVAARPAAAQEIAAGADDPTTRPAPVELGLFAGAFMPDDAHEFYDPRRTEQEPLQAAGPELGLRLAFFPIRFVGVEAEADILPQETESGDSVLLYGARAHLIAQLPTARITPFVLAGVGMMGVRSGDDELANDRDALGHIGIGAKLRLTDRLALRMEGRALRGPKAGVDTGTTHLAILLGVAIALGGGRDQVRLVARPATPPRPIARVEPPPPAPPPAPADRDQDSVVDDADRCPDQAGLADHQGCPDPDRDQDGVNDVVDNCPDQSGAAAHQGCAAAQLVAIDGDRLRLLEPITFTTNRAVLRPRSLPVLDNLAAVLLVHPEIARVRIAGHTDDRGDADHNRALSQDRAEAVRDYLVARGVELARLEAIGHGEDQPLEPNNRAAGRALNRRVDLEIIGVAEPAKTEPAKTEPAKTEPAKTEPAKTAQPEPRP